MEKKAGRLFAAWSLAAALCLLGGVPAQASDVMPAPSCMSMR